GKELPLSRHVFERAASAIFERDARAGGEVADGAGDEHLARPCLLAHTSSDYCGDPAGLPSDHLTFAGVNTRPNLEPERAHSISDRERAADGAARCVERRKETVAGRINLDAAVTADLASDDGVMTFNELAPTSVAELGSARRPTHDVGKENGCEEPVRRVRRADTGEELLDRVDDLVGLWGRGPKLVADGIL